MPTIYLRKDLYDAIVRANKDPGTFVNKSVEDALVKLQAVKSKESGG